VNVSARDARSGTAEDLSIHAPTSLSANQIEELKAEAADQFEEDKAQGEVKKQRHQIHQGIRELQSLLDNHGDELDGQQVSEARQVVVLAKEVLEEDEAEAFDEALTQLRSYKSALS
jgi:molecular chaperone DnaK (HSP70)